MVKRILFVNGGPLRRGGIETFMMNVFRNIDKSKFQIDFAVTGGEVGAYDHEIVDAGASIYRLPRRSRHPWQYMRALYHVLKSGRFDVVHAQLDAMNGVVLMVAKVCHVPVRISHSHNTAPMTRNKFKIAVQWLSKRLILKGATTLWACSDEAGRWLYGVHPFTVIHNAIDLQKFSFNLSKRKAIRKELGIEDNEILLGNVGRLDFQKNQDFLISLFDRLPPTANNIKCVCVGEGSDLTRLKLECKKRGLSSKFLFVGRQDNINEWYNSFDYFVLPSRFEGLGIVVIEAQANGMQCIVSDVVPKEVNLTGNVEFLSLDNLEAWINAFNQKKVQRDPMAIKSCAAGGYALQTEVRRIEKLYHIEICSNMQ